MTVPPLPFIEASTCLCCPRRCDGAYTPEALVDLLPDFDVWRVDGARWELIDGHLLIIMKRGMKSCKMANILPF